MRWIYLAVIASVATTAPAYLYAQEDTDIYYAESEKYEPGNFFFRMALGGGYLFNDRFRQSEDNYTAFGGSFEWSYAIGKSLLPWLAIHFTASGAAAPGPTVYSPGTEFPNTTGSLRATMAGGGATIRL
ncbi:MAG: hypothetical protein KC561_07480, partial [Myxococcales bacterium]|nr:hypothetical protein [Myxococcales bacterium]